jgi:DNA-binding transcriptional regulator YhcF (GntR family)
MPERVLQLRIDLSDPTPAYRQIVDALRTYLVDAKLNPGDLLPPVRDLALDLGVHFNTVAEAYRILADEGWLELKRRRGAKVLARNAPAAGPEERTLFDRRLREMVAEVRAGGVPAREIRQVLQTIAEGLK